MESHPVPEQPPIELSVVIPCLNEAETIGIYVQKALSAIAQHQIVAEVIVADNGSTDGCVELAELAGARVVHIIATRTS